MLLRHKRKRKELIKNKAKRKKHQKFRRKMKWNKKINNKNKNKNKNKENKVWRIFPQYRYCLIQVMFPIQDYPIPRYINK